MDPSRSGSVPRSLNSIKKMLQYVYKESNTCSQINKQSDKKRMEQQTRNLTYRFNSTKYHFKSEQYEKSFVFYMLYSLHNRTMKSNGKRSSKSISHNKLASCLLTFAEDESSRFLRNRKSTIMETGSFAEYQNRAEAFCSDGVGGNNFTSEPSRLDGRFCRCLNTGGINSLITPFPDLLEVDVVQFLAQLKENCKSF